MSDAKWETIEIQIDEELKQQVEKLIAPVGLTMERLLQMFFEWLVNPNTTEKAAAWLLKAKRKFKIRNERMLNDEKSVGIYKGCKQ